MTAAPPPAVFFSISWSEIGMPRKREAERERKIERCRNVRKEIA